MSKAGNCFVRFCNCLRGLPPAVLCVLILILQSASMDYYLVNYVSLAQLAWLAADAISLILLISSILSSLLYLRSETLRNDGIPSFAWIAWLVMNGVVAAKFIYIFNVFATELAEADPSFFGPNTLKTSIALSSCVFLLLLTTQHNEALGSDSRRYIEELTGTVVFDLLDTVDILDILFEKDAQAALWPGMTEFIVAVATLNLLLPAVPLLTLSRTKFGQKKLQKRLIYLHRLLLVLAVNVPNLLVRLILWHGFSVGITVFSLKNVILISMTLYEFYEHKKEKFEEHEREGSNHRNSPGAKESSNIFPHVYEEEPRRLRFTNRFSDRSANDNYEMSENCASESRKESRSPSSDRQNGVSEANDEYNGDFAIETRIGTVI